jgi:hypothetical protein
MAALSAAETHEVLEVPAREDLVRRCAYELHEGNGCVDGRDLNDWRAAEAEISGPVAGDAASSQAGETRIRNPAAQPDTATRIRLNSGGRRSCAGH